VQKVRSLLGVAAALTTISLMGSPAWGIIGACPQISNADPTPIYTAPGFSCTVGPITFSNFQFAGDVALTGIAPFLVDQTEFGLTLSFNGNLGPSGTNDLSWNFIATGTPGVGDVFASLNASAVGAAIVNMTEQLFNSVTGAPITTFNINTLNPPSSLTHFETFSPVPGVIAQKDEGAITGPASFAFASEITNAFSVPGPVVGAGMPGLVAACGGLLALARRRRQKIA